ncbi:MAG: DUF2971 domain-containing protein [Pseudomonadota bacterium]|nr:DUF2971 domain-containing protein [Pseudomonadota bacterium]
MAAQVLEEMNKYRICSLSSIKDSPLMWAYYAQGFEGVAIEVEIMKQVSLIEDVAYNDGHDLADYDPDGDFSMLARRFLLTKNKAWRHEKEVRIIKEADEGRTFHQLQERPTSVYMGVSINDENRRRLMKRCHVLGVRLFEMTLRGYKIAFREVDLTKPELPLG